MFKIFLEFRAWAWMDTKLKTLSQLKVSAKRKKLKGNLLEINKYRRKIKFLHHLWLVSPMLAILWHNPCSLVYLWRVRPRSREPARSLWLNEILQDHPICSKLSVQHLLSLRKTEGLPLASHSAALLLRQNVTVTSRTTNPAELPLIVQCKS